MKRKHTRKKYRAGQYDYRGIFCERVRVGTTRGGNPQYLWIARINDQSKTLVPFVIQRTSLGSVERRIDEIFGEN